MQIGILDEADEPRVAFSPETVKQLIESGNTVIYQKGAGGGAHFYDREYEAAGATLADSKIDVLNTAELLATYSPLEEADWNELKPDAVLISLYKPFVDDSIIERLKSTQFTAFSLDMIPRITLAQSMDVLSSMASIAGYRAVLEASEYLPRYYPMLSTAAGTVAPSKVLVIGAGVAGLQAIATAKRLGAVVEAFDTRTAAKEEVQSLGAKFVEVEGAKDDSKAGGYAVEQTEEYKQRQRELLAEKTKGADVIITTAQVRGPKAPVIITENMVDEMKAGSVIVDIAASTGGNCELTRNDEVVRKNGVTIVGNSKLEAKVSANASQMFGRNLFNFLKVMIVDGEFKPDWENQILKDSCIYRPDNSPD